VKLKFHNGFSNKDETLIINIDLKSLTNSEALPKFGIHKLIKIMEAKIIQEITPDKNLDTFRAQQLEMV
jgi:hypothetical protein